MAEAGRHPNIRLLTLTEVTHIGGYVGNFTVTIKRKPRYVTSDCSACPACADACPQHAPNEFDIGLATRKAIYLPFAQAVPSTFMIDMNLCLNKDGVRVCERCVQACTRKCIDFNDVEREEIIDVGTIVVATGVDTFDARLVPQYLYGKAPNVITSLEFERLINAGGPTHGHLIRPSDHQVPKSVAFVQCVGSRSEKHQPYCSNVCCMNTVKDALLIREHWPETEIKVFYTDMRTFGKGFEELYQRARKEGVQFIRGLPGEIVQRPNGDLRMLGEMTLMNKLYDLDVGMVILSVGLVPSAGSAQLRSVMALPLTNDGFFMVAHPKLRPVDTPTRGIFLAGCSEGPKDIKDSVMQAGAAAARANNIMCRGSVTVDAITAEVDRDQCTGCGACTKVCPYHAITLDDQKKAVVVGAACSGCGTCGAECSFDAITMRHFTDDQIMAQIDVFSEHEPERKILAFNCNWCSYAGADFAGVGRMQYPPEVRIIRTMCSGRVAQRFVEHAFARGVASVLISGCHIGDCHYIDANVQTDKRHKRLRKIMEQAGLDPERLQLVWVSAAEGQRFQEKIQEMKKKLDGLTTQELEKARAFFREREGKRERAARPKAKPVQEEARV
jgi:heterodisulfide reductase subunit A